MLSHKLTDDAELRLLLPHHAAEHTALIQKNSHHLNRWLPWATSDYDDTKSLDLINRYMKRLAEDQGMLIGLFYQGQLAGWLCFREWDRRNQIAEIGYLIGEDFQGKGLIGRAVEAMITFAFTDLGMNRVEIIMDVENVRSAAVPQRLGFTLECTRKQGAINNGQKRDLYVYVLLHEEWQARR